jgi:AcrR family transcriptional regulator
MVDGRTARWERHREEQRGRIVEAAVALIEGGDPSPSLIDVGRRAGLARSVVYRHFADKAELDAAVHTHVVTGLWHDLAAQVRLHGSLRDTVQDALRAYVGWAAAHPALHAMDDEVSMQGVLRKALDSIAAQVAQLSVEAFSAAGAEVTPADRLATGPLAYGLVTGIFATVSRWVHQGARVPSAEGLVTLLADVVIAMVVDRAAAYGVALDPDTPLSTLLAG